MSDQATTALASLNLWAELATINPWTFEDGEPARIFLEVTADGGAVTVVRDLDPDSLPFLEADAADARATRGDSFIVRGATIYEALREVLAYAQECGEGLRS